MHTFLKPLMPISFLLGVNFVNAETPISDAYSPGESDSKWVVGAKVLGWKNPYINDGGDDEHQGAFIPNVEYRGERFFVDSDGLGVTLFRNNGFSTGLILGGQDSYLSDDDYFEDNDRLEGIDERDPTADLGAYVIHNHNNGQLKVTLRQEITDEHDGQTADARYLYNFPIGRWNITPVAGISWASEETINHFVGVSERESQAANNISAYEGKSTTSFFGGVTTRYDINDHWDVTFDLAHISLGEGIKDSPLIEDDNVLVTGFGVNYNF